jgi:YVTN family beta-propeller protein
MEYLMTYGWAILIVAVVLGALYGLGIFNGSNFLGGTCVAAPGYLCTNPLLATDGVLNFTYGYQGSNVTIVGFACTNSSVAPTSFSLTGSSTLSPGQQESASATCTLPSDALGTQFSGYLWVEYDQAGQSNLIARFATITTTVDVSGSDKLYVANSNTGTVLVVDLLTGDVVNTITVGTNPDIIAMTPNDEYAYVTDYGGSAVSRITLATNTTTDTISGITDPTGVTISPDGKYAYVVGINSGTVDVISVPSDAIANSVLVGSGLYLWGDAITPDGTQLYIGNGRGSGTPGYVYMMYTSNDVVASSVQAGYGTGPIAVTPDGDYVWATNYWGGTVTVINTATQTVTDSILLPSGAGPEWLAFTPNGEYAYVTDSNLNQVYVIDTSTYGIVATIPISSGNSPDFVTIDPTGSTAYVASGGASGTTVTKINVATEQVSGVISGFSSPHGSVIVT